MTSFTQDFFRNNRRQLYATLAPHSFLALTANGAMQCSPDGAYAFEQEANFWYLTGIDYADWLLLVDVDKGEEWLVAPATDTVHDIFNGSLSVEHAIQQSGVRQVLETRAGLTLLRELCKQKEQAYILKPQPRRLHEFYTNPAQRDLARKLAGVKKADVRPQLARQRAVKQPQEINAITKAVDISVAGIKAMLKKLPRLNYEYEVEAELTYAFRHSGAKGHAYDPIVAAGGNACTLHYIANNSPLDKRRWLLFDVGARYDHYAADITRTVPLGAPTKRHQAIYEAARRVHDFAVNLCRPGQSTRDYVKRVDEHMGSELIKLGLITKNDYASVRQYFPHAISHGLGIDVHDPLGRAEVFVENMVLTVEPGIYVPEEKIGVRLEDDILITAKGPRVLSGGLPL